MDFIFLTLQKNNHMKKSFLYIILFLFSVSVCQAQLKLPAKVKWYTIQQVMELQKKEPRKIMIDVYTDWCGWCKKMDAETYANPVIAEYLNTHYYAVKFNAESTDSLVFAGKTFKNENTGNRSPHQFAVALLQGKMSYPSVAYLNEKFQLLATIPGYFTAQNLEPLLNFIVEDKYSSISLEEYQKTFKSKIN
jgi:thioredoxin-related protein